MAKVGTMDTKPIRVDYANGNYSKAFDMLTEAGIKIVYKTVNSVEPYYATIHLDNIEDREQAKKMLEDAGISWYLPAPAF